jgi:hypothetical protein
MVNAEDGVEVAPVEDPAVRAVGEALERDRSAFHVLEENKESQRLQYALADRARDLRNREDFQDILRGLEPAGGKGGGKCTRAPA